jgi:LPS-assembly lipoprotein
LTLPLTARPGAANIAPRLALHRVSPVIRFLFLSRARWLLLVCLAAVLAGCGYRLQGTSKLSPVMATTYIETNDRYTDFNRALRESLEASGARVANNKDEATAVVRILKDESGQRVLTVSGRNTPEEYEVYYSIEYAVEGRTEQLIPPQRVELTRDYSYDERAVLAKQKEQAILREALARDLAGLVVRRLASL